MRTRSYLTTERRLAPSSLVVASSALRFLYHVTLKKDWTLDDVIPQAKRRRSLPVVLSPEEVAQLLDAVQAVKHRAILTTCYAARQPTARSTASFVSACARPPIRRPRRAPRPRRGASPPRNSNPTMAASTRAVGRLGRRHGLEPAVAPGDDRGRRASARAPARHRRGLLGVLARDAVQRVLEGRGALYRMARELAESVIKRHRQRRQGRARRITIDLDPTDDPTHGAQQLTFFNGFYDTWCYLPLLAFVTFGREAEQYLCAAVLRSGKAVASEGAVALLSRLLPLLRCAFPRARFLVRLDAGFATPEVFDFLDACPRLDYVISIPKNAVLLRHAEPAMTRARARSARSGRTEHVYGETRYAAGSWKQQRRVVIKAEVVRLAGREPRDNPASW